MLTGLLSSIKSIGIILLFSLLVMSIFAITGTILFRVRFMHVQVGHVHCMLQSPFTWMYMYVHICTYLLVIMQNIGNYVHVSICVYILAGKFFLLH